MNNLRECLSRFWSMKIKIQIFNVLFLFEQVDSNQDYILDVTFLAFFQRRSFFAFTHTPIQKNIHTYVCTQNKNKNSTAYCFIMLPLQARRILYLCGHKTWVIFFFISISVIFAVSECASTHYTPKFTAAVNKHSTFYRGRIRPKAESKVQAYKRTRAGHNGLPYQNKGEKKNIREFGIYRAYICAFSMICWLNYFSPTRCSAL